MSIVEIYKQAEATLSQFHRARLRSEWRVTFTESEGPDTKDVERQSGVMDFDTGTQRVRVERESSNQKKSGEWVRTGNKVWVRSNQMPAGLWYEDEDALSPLRLEYQLTTRNLASTPNVTREGDENGLQMTRHSAEVEAATDLIPVLRAYLNIGLPPSVSAAANVWVCAGHLHIFEFLAEFESEDGLPIKVEGFAKFSDLGTEHVADLPEDAYVLSMFNAVERALNYEGPPYKLGNQQGL